MAQRTLIPLPRLCQPGAWPPAPTVSHSGSSCPRSFLHWIFKLCALLPLPGAVFQTQGSIYFFTKMGRKNLPLLDTKKRKEKRKEIKLSKQTAEVVWSLWLRDLFHDFISTQGAHVFMALMEERRQPMRIAKVHAVGSSLPWMSFHRYASFSCLLVLGLSVRHPHLLAPANGSSGIVQRQT